MDRPERIVSLAPSNTEILYALGAEERLVATTALCDFPAEAREKPSVGGWTNSDTSAVVEHEPDLVLASDALQDAVVARCEAEGLRVEQVEPVRLQDVLNSIKAIGEWVGAEDAARDLVAEMNDRFRELRVDGEVRVYCEEWTKPPMASGNWVPRLVDLAGGESLLDEGERSRTVTLDELRDFDPEVVVLHPCGYGDGAEPETVAGRDGWDALTAVQEGRVDAVDDALLNRPGPRLVDGLEALRDAIQGSEQSRT